jgi:hypothetical protein
LLDLPKRYQNMLMTEAMKPKEEQTISVDLFLEINKAKRAIQSYVPEVFDRVTESDFVDSMVEKYTSGVVNNVVKFRDVGRIARAERAGGNTAEAKPVLINLVRRPRYTIDEAYSDSVMADYQVRDIDTRTTALTERLAAIRNRRVLPLQTMGHLHRLRKEIQRLVGDE